jgi:transcriptional regulator GlxA family with amidase domain
MGLTTMTQDDIDNGRVICSAGIAAGIDMSFHVVARLLGQDVARKTASHIEYTWQEQIA